jgi:hypothetical protein
MPSINKVCAKLCAEWLLARDSGVNKKLQCIVALSYIFGYSKGKDLYPFLMLFQFIPG